MLAYRRANTLAAASLHACAPRVDRGHTLLCPRVGGARACTLPLAPAHRRLGSNNLGDDAEKALKANVKLTGSRLELNFG